MLGGWCYDFVRALSHGSFVTSLRMVPLRAHRARQRHTDGRDKLSYAESGDETSIGVS